MNRVIKFRAWVKTLKRMAIVTGWLYDFSVYLKNGTGRGTGSANREDVILMQFTGLYDRHGVEIFEGDIVQTENEHQSEYPCEEQFTGVVTYIEDSWHIVQPHDEYKPTLKNIMIRSMEVIGNVYEHPSLLAETSP